MRRFLITWLFNIGALFVAAKLLSGIDYDDLGTLVVAGFVFSAVNLFLRPLLIVLAIPAVVLTLGIALFFVNLLMLYMTDWIVGEFEIDGFWSAVGGTIVVWIVNWALHAVFGKPERVARDA